MKTTKQNIKWLLFFVAFIILIDFSPILYYKIITPNGNWPEFYRYHITTTKLIKAIDNLKSDSISISYIPDRRKNPSNYIAIVFFDKLKNDYYYTWVLVDSVRVKNYTEIIFGCVGKSIDYKKDKYVNVDYDFLTSYLIRKRFEKLVINKLKVD